VLIAKVDADSPKVLREMNDQFRERLKSGVIVLGAIKEEKVFLLVGVTPDLTERVHAGRLIGEIAKEVGGSGGGRPDMAQAGGTRPEKLEDALKLAGKFIQERLTE
jgi:alanyl-tRNA synthetase